MNKIEYIFLHYKSKIEQNEFDLNSKLPSKNIIAKKFDASINEVNASIDKLIKIGYIKESKKEFLVSFKRAFKKVDKIESFTNDVLATGQIPGSRILEYHLFRAIMLPVLQEKMRLNDDDLIHYIVRIRTVNDLPVALSYNYISSKYLKLVNTNIMNESIYETLKNNGAIFTKSHGEMTASISTEEQERNLNIKNEALLKDSTYLYDQDECVIEYDEVYYVSSRYGYFYTTLNCGGKK